MLAAASVVGRRFDLSLLAKLVAAELSLQETLHELQRLGFVVADRRWPQPQYRFKHVLIQEAIYSHHPRGRAQAPASSGGRGTRGPRRGNAGAHTGSSGALARGRRPGAGHFLLSARSRARPPGVRERRGRRGAHPRAQPPRTGARGSSPRRGGARAYDHARCRAWLGLPRLLQGSRSLCRLGRAVSPPILRGLALNSLLRLELDDAREDGIALLAAGERDEDPMLMVEGEYVLGVTSFWEGELLQSRRHLENAIERYSSERHETHTTLYSQDPKVVCLSRLAWTLWFLGLSRPGGRGA